MIKNCFLTIFLNKKSMFGLFFVNDTASSCATAAFKYFSISQNYVNFDHYIFIIFSVQIFLFGLVGMAFNKRNFISLLLSIEIMFLGLGLIFIGFSSLKYTFVNFSIPILILGVSACETAIGLSILVFTHKYGWQTDNLLFKKSQVRKLQLSNTRTSFYNLVDDEETSFKNFLSNPINKNKNLIFILVFFSKQSAYYHQNNIDDFLMKNFDYLNVFFFWLTSFLLLSLLLLASRLLSLYKPSKQKLSSYECGFEPFSDSRGKQDVLFYVIAILFILFDVELVFILPWAATHSFLPASSYFLVFFFIFTLILGFFYEWKNGALNWITKENKKN